MLDELPICTENKVIRAHRAGHGPRTRSGASAIAPNPNGVVVTSDRLEHQPASLTTSMRTTGTIMVEAVLPCSGVRCSEITTGAVRRCCCTSVLYSNRADLRHTAVGRRQPRPVPQGRSRPEERKPGAAIATSRTAGVITGDRLSKLAIPPPRVCGLSRRIGSQSERIP